MLEAMVEWMGFPLFYAYDGASPPERTGSDHASIYPYGIFHTQERNVILIGLQNEREWRIFCELILGKPELITDLRFADNAARSANRADLRKIIQNLFSTLSSTEVCKKLDAAQIAFAKVNNMEEVWNHPQLKALNRIVSTQTPHGIISSFKPPTNNSEFEPVLSSVPAVGEHSRNILEELGFEHDQIDWYFANEVV